MEPGDLVYCRDFVGMSAGGQAVLACAVDGVRMVLCPEGYHIRVRKVSPPLIPAAARTICEVATWAVGHPDPSAVIVDILQVLGVQIPSDGDIVYGPLVGSVYSYGPFESVGQVGTMGRWKKRRRVGDAEDTADADTGDPKITDINYETRVEILEYHEYTNFLPEFLHRVDEGRHHVVQEANTQFRRLIDIEEMSTDYGVDEVIKDSGSFILFGYFQSDTSRTIYMMFKSFLLGTETTVYCVIPKHVISMRVVELGTGDEVLYHRLYGPVQHAVAMRSFVNMVRFEHYTQDTFPRWMMEAALEAPGLEHLGIGSRKACVGAKRLRISPVDPRRPAVAANLDTVHLKAGGFHSGAYNRPLPNALFGRAKVVVLENLAVGDLSIPETEKLNVLGGASFRILDAATKLKVVFLGEVGEKQGIVDMQKYVNLSSLVAIRTSADLVFPETILKRVYIVGNKSRTVVRDLDLGLEPKVTPRILTFCADFAYVGNYTGTFDVTAGNIVLRDILCVVRRLDTPPEDTDIEVLMLSLTNEVRATFVRLETMPEKDGIHPIAVLEVRCARMWVDKMAGKAPRGVLKVWTSVLGYGDIINNPMPFMPQSSTVYVAHRGMADEEQEGARLYGQWEGDGYAFTTAFVNCEGVTTIDRSGVMLVGPRYPILTGTAERVVCELETPQDRFVQLRNKSGEPLGENDVFRVTIRPKEAVNPHPEQWEPRPWERVDDVIEDFMEYQ